MPFNLCIIADVKCKKNDCLRAIARDKVREIPEKGPQQWTNASKLW